jgi:hypothetical protein
VRLKENLEGFARAVRDEVADLRADLEAIGSGADLAAVATSGQYADLLGLPSLFDGSWASLTGKPLTFTPSAHTHVITDVTGLQTALDGKQAAGSYASAAQGALAATALQPGAEIPWSTLSGVPSTFTPASHTHALSDVTGLVSALAGKQDAGSYQPLASALTDTTAAFTTEQQSKLAGISAGATVNATDAALRDRSTHTGSQAAGTITGLAAIATSGDAADLSGNLPVARLNGGASAAADTFWAGDGTWKAPASGVAAAWTAATVTISNAFEVEATVTATGVTPSDVLSVMLAPGADTDENVPEMLSLTGLSAIPGTDNFALTLEFSERTSGPINILWRP